MKDEERGGVVQSCLGRMVVVELERDGALGNVSKSNLSNST